MQRVGIPTARFVRIETPQERHSRRSPQFEYPVVVKADGLAAGKGVIIAHDRARSRSRRSLARSAPGDRRIPRRRRSQLHRPQRRPQCRPARSHAGSQNRRRRRHRSQHRRHGRLLRRPHSLAADAQRILDTIIEPAVRATGFTGFLYAGLMMTADGPKVLEFNVRLGRSGNATSDASPGRRLRRSAGCAPPPAICTAPASLEARAVGVRGARGRTAIPDKSAPATRSPESTTLRRASVPRRHQAGSAGPRDLREAECSVSPLPAPIWPRPSRNAYAGGRQDSLRRNALPPRHRQQGSEALGPLQLSCS